VTLRFASGKLLAKEQIDLTVIKAAELTGRVFAGIGVTMEKSNSISAFDLLRQRLNMPDPWTLTEPRAVSKRQIAAGRISRIFGHMLVLLGPGSISKIVPTKSIVSKLSQLCGVRSEQRDKVGRVV